MLVRRNGAYERKENMELQNNMHLGKVNRKE